MRLQQKKKVLGGKEYRVRGSTIARDKNFNIVFKRYSTTDGKVLIKDGKVFHPDGTITNE